MNKERLAEAKKQAEEFLMAVKAFETETAGNSPYAWFRSKNAATVKRRSMDLTNALSNLRKNE